MDLAIIEPLVRLAWLAGAAAFVLGLMQMNSPATARNGNLLSAGGMALAIVATAISCSSSRTTAASTSPAGSIIIAGIALGGGLGLYTARTVKMTAMPQLVSLFNAVGGGAAALIAIDDYLRLARPRPALQRPNVAIVLDIVIGGDHLHRLADRVRQADGPHHAVAAGQGPRRPADHARPGAGRWSSRRSSCGSATSASPVLFVIIAAALIFGVTMVLPIGGADMPVVISLLNSFTGTAVAMATITRARAPVVSCPPGAFDGPAATAST